jgi:hypothetical protein
MGGGNFSSGWWRALEPVGHKQNPATKWCGVPDLRLHQVNLFALVVDIDVFDRSKSDSSDQTLVENVADL